jgi:hypothetical protein
VSSEESPVHDKAEVFAGKIFEAPQNPRAISEGGAGADALDRAHAKGICEVFRARTADSD